jgi:hypothetical protein
MLKSVRSLLIDVSKLICSIGYWPLLLREKINEIKALSQTQEQASADLKAKLAEIENLLYASALSSARPCALSRPMCWRVMLMESPRRQCGASKSKQRNQSIIGGCSGRCRQVIIKA